MLRPMLRRYSTGRVDARPAKPALDWRSASPTALFVAGFLFDFLTMQRIDAWLDLAFQLAYLTGLTILLIAHDRRWRYHTEVLHFLYGGLLSAYVVLYFR